MIRKANNALQVCKQMSAMAANLTSQPETDGAVQALSRAVGVNQHHDAVTGTSKQVVAFDYAQRLSDGIEGCHNKVVAQAYNNFKGQALFSLPLA